MARILLRRLIGMVVVLFLLTVVTFCLMHVSPSDPVQMIMLREGMPPDPAYVAVVREKYGLDKPLAVQYFLWLKGIFHRDFGFSLLYNEPVSILMKDAIPKTVTLVFCSLLLGAAVSIPLSILAYRYHNGPLDYGIRFLTFVTLAIPTFLMSFILIYIFSVRLHLLPVNARGSSGLILPSIALGTWLVGLYARRLRNSFLEEYRKNYITGARVLGLRDSTIFWKYLVPNSLPAIISMAGLTVGSMLGGSAVVETIFGWRGMGELMVEAILNQDYQLMQGYILWGAGIFIVVNFLADLLCMYLNPELLEKEKAKYGSL